ncbi:MAG: acyl-ACP--UDP-N-acetylglucosamine O-acyltransferase [Acidobacteriota bacterium]
MIETSCIDRLAAVHPAAQVAEGVAIGPFTTIGENVKIGAGTQIGPHVNIEGWTEIGEDNRISAFVSIGGPPQDLKYAGEMTVIRIGNRNVLREFVTVNRGTKGGGGVTSLGDDNFLMAYAHIAHDCHVGNHCILANAATLAGHVEIEDHVTLGAFCGVHQFCRLGRHCFIGGYSVITKDVLPYSKTVGARSTRCYGPNALGLRRKSFSPESIIALQRAFRRLLQPGLNTRQAVDQIEGELAGDPEVDYLVHFIRTSRRGTYTRAGGEGGD